MSHTLEAQCQRGLNSSSRLAGAVDLLGLEPSVDRNRIGVFAICGLSGMLTAATADSRIEAVATTSMYDMSRSISRSYGDGFYTKEQRHQVIDWLSQQRWADAERGSYAPGLPLPLLGGRVRAGRGAQRALDCTGRQSWDVYDRVEKIPFDALADFFRKNLK